MIYAFLVLLLVLGFFLIIVLLLRKLNIYGKKFLGNTSKFKIQDVIYLDSNTKMFSVHHVDTEYLILLSKNGNMLIDKRSSHVIDG